MTLKPGDKIRFPGLPEATVIAINHDPIFGTTDVRYVYPGSPNFYLTTLETAEAHRVTSEDNPFPTGSIVRFKRDRYRVEDFDGELHRLVNLDGDENLYYPPDMFELVQPPPPEVDSVWEHKHTAFRVLVSEVDASANTVELVFSDASETTVSVEKLHETYTQLL